MKCILHERFLILPVTLIRFSVQSGLAFTPLLTHPSPHLPPRTIISALSPHPSNPFHLFVATSRELLLLDTRQPDPSLLATHHELHDPPQFISAVCNHGDSILVNLSKKAKSYIDHLRHSPVCWSA